VSEIISDIAQLRSQVQFVVVCIPWGREGIAIPYPETRTLAHEMVSAGAGLILGHHPHFVQPVERVGKSLIAYSLGDFLFDLFWDRRMVESALLTVTVGEEGIIDHRLTPVRLDRDYCLRQQDPKTAHRFFSEIDVSAHLMSTTTREELDRMADRADAVGSLRKVAHFATNMHRGDRGQKMAFLREKVMAKLHRTK
jgi:hypothetical protein